MVLWLLSVICVQAYVPFPSPPPPLPSYTPTYNMSLSTIIMPCNYTGWFDVQEASKWGIVDLDWSNDKSTWVNVQPMDDQERLVTAAQDILAHNPAARVWVYRNLVWAPSWYSEIRAKIMDPAYAQWFVPYKPTGPYKNAPCTFEKCSTLFHSQFQCPEYNSTDIGSGSCKEHCDCGSVPCAWYLWDHRNESLRNWIANVHVLGPLGLESPYVEGLFLDDEWFDDGPQQEGPGSEYAIQDTGMSQSDILEMKAAWRKTMDLANAAVVTHKGYNWRLFYNNSTIAQAPFAVNECTEYMNIACSKNSPLQQLALMYGFESAGGKIKDLTQHLASFLLIRGPFAWLGWSWIGCGAIPPRPAELDQDYGQPEGLCQAVQGKPGVFARNWTRAAVTLDCIHWTASITPR